MWRLLKFFLYMCCVFQGHTELESLQQENEVLKAQMARLSTQLLDVGCGTNFYPSILMFLTLNLLMIMMMINFCSPILQKCCNSHF